MKPWLCSCHKSPMYWNIDTRYKRGGYWACREKRRERNQRRVTVFGTRMYVSNGEIAEFARRLRDERKEAQ